MVYIELPGKNTRRLSFYLAMEEYVARTLNTLDDCFFMWQVQPSVIVGRNQLIETEVNIPFCKAHNISVYRRKSGGGCVYADMSNVMFSYITRDENVNLTFNRYINQLVLVLYRMGIEAKNSGRNDVMIDGKKVSGNAFYHIPGHSIVHGTMLYDTDMQNMVHSITPSNDKLISKGVQSVRQHIALLKDYTQISLEEFKSFVRQNLCKETLSLSDEDVIKIEEIEQEYLSERFIYGSNPKYAIVKKQFIKDVGHFDIRLVVKNGVIKDIDILGDYFICGDVDKKLLEPLRGVELNEESIAKALPYPIDDVIMNLETKDFINMLIKP